MRHRGELNLEGLCSLLAILGLLFAIIGAVCLGIDFWDRYSDPALVDTKMREHGLSLLVLGVSFFAGFGLLSWLLFKYSTRHRKR